MSGYELTPSANRELQQALAGALRNHGATATAELIDGDEGTVLHVKVRMPARDEAARRAVVDAVRNAAARVFPDLMPVVSVFRLP